MLQTFRFATGKGWLGRLMPNAFYFKSSGFCPCCRQPTEFLAIDAWLRDHFHCLRCNSVPRQRALMMVIDRHCPDWPASAVHESSPTGGGASARLKRDCSGYLSSQYHPGLPFGTMVGESRNEDLENQTFADASFDLVVTQDVMEHVYDPRRAFQEIAGTLKPGGAHIFSVPLVNKHRPTQRWATKNGNGAPDFLFEPEYHGNPVDPQGAPVTMHWGYDIVDFIRDACGLETSIDAIDDLSHGVRAEYIEILVTRKPGGPTGLRSRFAA